LALSSPLFTAEIKKPAGLVAGGLGSFFEPVADLDQAVAVRRHGMSMMVVMAVMVADLHLFFTLS
jgi:hypothetical protein